MKRAPLVLFLIITLASVVILVQSNLAFASLPQVVINSDGTVTPSDMPLNHVGNTYYFTADISNHSIKINCDNITIDGQGFTLQGRPDYGSDYGLYLLNRNNVTIRNLNIKSYAFGVEMIANYLTSLPNKGIDITNNTITNCMTGVMFDGAINCSISRNRFLNNGQGINMINSSFFNAISENIIANNGGGINVVTSSNNTFMLNTISENENGIRVDTSKGNIFARNNFTGNNVGILFESLIGTSSDNLFYSNNFINNSRHIREEFKHDIPLPQSNIWDNDTRGNYWDDYSARYPNAVEIDNSGIGDTPYVINADNIDHYPLMAPVDYVSPSILILSPENRTYDKSSIQLNFTANEPLSRITYSLDGEPQVTVTGNTTLTGLNNGKHSLTIYATDEAGNIGASNTVHFSVDVAFPTFAVAAVSGASATAIAAGVLVYLRRRKR